MEESNFSQELKEALSKKQEWFNSVRLQDLVNQYRLMNTCFHNLYETLAKKNIIIPDPYRLDKRINSIVVPENGQYSDSDMGKVMGTRFSDFDVMLDYLCTYFRFTIDSLSLPTLKKLLDFNKTFDWGNISSNSTNPNTRGFAALIATAKMGSPSVIQSMINDSIDKCVKCADEIGKILNEVGIFQRELYKGELRKDLFEHPDFNHQKAMASSDAEMAEIKRLYPKVIGKKPFYNDLVGEIIAEDQAPDKERLQAAVLSRLQIKEAVKSQQKKKAGPDSKELLMTTVLAIGGMAPTFAQLRIKLDENFKVLFTKKQNFFSKLGDLLKKAFHLKEKEKIINLPIKDSKTGFEKIQKLHVNDFMATLFRKEHVYNGIGAKGPEYSKIESANEDAILVFVNKQISETQSDFTIINALDAYFKNNVEEGSKTKVKGMQIELSALRNSIINANKKRGEYASFKEESEQMKKLGISENV
ncbi:MAG: hypothetical protein K6C97_03680 [Treponema sp.]|nr:hypothetical protein [Treponema sp.]